MSKLRERWQIYSHRSFEEWKWVLRRRLRPNHPYVVSFSEEMKIQVGTKITLLLNYYFNELIVCKAKCPFFTLDTAMASVSILVSSFDGFADCWGPVCHGFSRYWPDCPYSIYLMTNEKLFSNENINVIRLGQDYGWTKNLRVALKQIDSTYVIYFQEDYWINEKVNSLAISQYVSIMDEQHLNYIRLLAHPVPDYEFSDDKRLGILATNAPYRTALQAAIWRKEVLLDLLEEDESPWQFEVQGTIRSQKYEGTFLSVKKYENDPYYYGIRYVCTAINQGRWARIAKEYAKHEGLVVAWDNLPSETWWHEFKRENKIGAWAHLTIYRINLIARHPVIACQKLLGKLFGTITTKGQSNRG